MNQAPTPCVLLVEDNEDDALLFRRAWRKAEIGLALDHVEDGQQAIDYLSARERAAERPVLVLLDLKLPMIHGFEVLAWARSRREFDEMCIVVLSSSPEPTDVERAYALGANSYLTKAVSPDTLRELIGLLSETKPRAMLELRAAERAKDSRSSIRAEAN